MRSREGDRETITRMDRDLFNATWESHRDGKWSAYSIETVRRAGPGVCQSRANSAGG